MRRQDTAPRWLLAVVIAVHGAALLGLARPDLRPTSPPRPLEVALLAPPTPEPAPAPAPQPPRQQQKLPAKPRPAPSRLPAPAPSGAITIPEASAPESPGSAAPSTVAAAPTEAPPATAHAPAPVQPARFDAAYLRNPKPPYPALSRRLGEQGKVLLRVFVNAEGLAETVELKASSGSSRLDESALETVRGKWRFEPARQGDKPVGAWVVVPINFHLEG